VVTVCCSVLQCDAVCCSVMPCVAVTHDEAARSAVGGRKCPCVECVEMNHEYFTNFYR